MKRAPSWPQCPARGPPRGRFTSRTAWAQRKTGLDTEFQFSSDHEGTYLEQVMWQWSIEGRLMKSYSHFGLVPCSLSETLPSSASALARAHSNTVMKCWFTAEIEFADWSSSSVLGNKRMSFLNNPNNRLENLEDWVWSEQSARSQYINQHLKVASWKVAGVSDLAQQLGCVARYQTPPPPAEQKCCLNTAMWLCVSRMWHTPFPSSNLINSEQLM